MTKIVNRVKALHAARSGQLPDLGLLAGRPAVGTAPFDSAEEDHKQDNDRREMLEELLMGWPSSCGQNHSAGDPRKRVSNRTMFRWGGNRTWRHIHVPRKNAGFIGCFPDQAGRDERMAAFLPKTR
jgi:hypothetical protein